ncbi:6-O-methylguanine DNA methyltransferase [Scleroderma citrinum]
MLNAQEFNLAVHQIIQAVPSRKVITCGHIANLLGVPNQARRVRAAVNFITHTTPPVPWHRVVSTSGVISVHGSNAQQHLLEEEGVKVSIGTAGESRVHLNQWGWFPDPGSVKIMGTAKGLEDELEWGA